MRIQSSNFTSLSGFVALCLSISAIGGAVTHTSVNTWYQELEKPIYTPPDWVFSPVWISLYLMMGISAWLIWLNADSKARRYPLTVFGVQLVLNLAWSFIFFGARAVGWAFIEICFLWIAIAANIRVFWQVDKLAGWLLVPYIMWVTYAVVLNGAIYSLN